MASQRILAVDDESDVLMIVRTALEAEAYEVVTAGNGVDALALADEQEFDLILLDVMMPGMDGFEVMRRLRERAKTRETPIVMLTGLAEKSMVKQALDLGVSHYIIKPFEFQEFLQVIQKALVEDSEDDIVTV